MNAGSGPRIAMHEVAEKAAAASPGAVYDVRPFSLSHFYRFRSFSAVNGLVRWWTVAATPALLGLDLACDQRHSAVCLQVLCISFRRVSAPQPHVPLGLVLANGDSLHDSTLRITTCTAPLWFSLPYFLCVCIFLLLCFVWHLCTWSCEIETASFWKPSVFHLPVALVPAFLGSPLPVLRSP